MSNIIYLPSAALLAEALDTLNAETDEMKRHHMHEILVKRVREHSVEIDRLYQDG